MKKPLLLMLALVFALTIVLAGCSGGSNSGDAPKAGDEPAQTSEGTTTTPAPEPEKPKEKVKITFWHVWSDKDSGPITERVTAFNESQDEIEVEVLGNQDATKQLTAISGGNPPDVALTFWNNIGPWADAGAVLSLEQFISTDNYDLNQYVPAALERMVVNGEHYALPLSMSMASTLMYNKKAFADAGITAPPETLEQMFEYAKQLTKKDGSNITNIGFIPDYPWIDNVFWPIIFGGDWVDANGKLTANQAANVASIAYQRQFYEQFGDDQIAKFRSGMGQRGTPQDPLLTGQLAMMIGWEYNFPAERAEDGPIGIAPFPYPEANPELKGSGMVSPRAVFIPSKAKNPEAAWTFMKYLLGVDSQVEFAIDSKTIPSVKAALDDERLTKNEELKPMWSFYERAKSETLQGFPNSTYINEYLQALNEETEKALKGTISPQEAMDNVVAKIQPLADEANK